MVVIIDTKSTHNLIDPNVAKRKNLYTNGSDNLTVMVTNGEHVPCLDGLQLQGQSFLCTPILTILGMI